MVVVYVFLDFESTGLSCYQDQIVQFASVTSTWKPATPFTSYVQPKRKMSFMASKITQITDAKLAHMPAFPSVFAAWITWLQNLLLPHPEDDNNTFDPPLDDRLDNQNSQIAPTPVTDSTLELVTHNGFAFDYALLWCECARHKIDLLAELKTCKVVRLWDTLDIAKQQSFKAQSAPVSGPKLSNALGKVFQRAFGHEMAHAHDALGDVVGLRQLVEAFHLPVCTSTLSLSKPVIRFHVLFCERFRAWKLRQEQPPEETGLMRRTILLPPPRRATTLSSDNLTAHTAEVSSKTEKILPPPEEETSPRQNGLAKATPLNNSTATPTTQGMTQREKQENHVDRQQKRARTAEVDDRVNNKKQKVERAAVGWQTPDQMTKKKPGERFKQKPDKGSKNLPLPSDEPSAVVAARANALQLACEFLNKFRHSP